MGENFQIKIQDRPSQFLIDIFIFRRTHDNKIVIYGYSNMEDTIREKTFLATDAIPPTLTIPTNLLPILLEAITKQGVKPPEQSFVNGKLEATTAHLEDMRKLVFKNDGN